MSGKRIYCLIVCGLLCVGSVCAKMHIHTDASDYRAGGRIWFRIHMLDACTLLPDTTAEVVLVELISPRGDITKRVKLLRQDDLFSGYMDIPTHAEAGQYLLRSYTRGMETSIGYAGKQIVYIHGMSVAKPAPEPDLTTDETESDTIAVPQVSMPLEATKRNGIYHIRIGTDNLHTGERVLVSAAITDRYAISRHTQWTILRTFSRAPFVDPVIAPSAANICIRGYVLSPVRRKGIGGAIVNMIIPGTYYYATDTTDRNGLFTFADEMVQEGESVLLSAYRPDGSQNVVISTEDEVFPPYEGIAPALIQIERSRMVFRRELYDITDSVLLDEIEVNAKRLIKESTREKQSMYVADMSFGMNKIDEYNATNLYDLLRRVPGLRIEEGKCYIRGAHSIYASNPAAIAINGVLQEDMYDLDLIPIQDIARLDIFKSGTTAIWGARGGAGVISIILKDGTEIPKQSERTDIRRYRPLGWQQQQEFFLPPMPAPSRRPETILWDPNVRSEVLTLTPGGYPTVYDVVIEGVTTEGRLIHEQTAITVE